MEDLERIPSSNRSSRSSSSGDGSSSGEELGLDISCIDGDQWVIGVVFCLVVDVLGIDTDLDGQ